MPPLRSLAKAIAALSGDHAGSASNAASFVNCTAVPPTGSTHKSPSAVNATDRPSGETAGLTIPLTRCAPVASSGRGAIENELRWSETVALNGMVAVDPSSERRLISPSAV